MKTQRETNKETDREGGMTEVQRERIKKRRREREPFTSTLSGRVKETNGGQSKKTMPYGGREEVKEDGREVRHRWGEPEQC